MTKIANFDDVHRVLSEYVPRTHESGSYSLDRIREILLKLYNPQNNYRTVHVAGTSGKTSTCYYVDALLRESGVKTGMTVSPHVDEVNERVQINGNPLPEAQFCRLLEEFIDIVDTQKVEPTYFELLIAFAFWVFAREKVEYAVVEVGLGGLLDGTNVITRPDKVCVITDIGLDHTNVLGNTIAEIAAQKAGIIQEHNTVFSYRQDEDTMAAIIDRCKNKHAQLHEITKIVSMTVIDNLPPFQQRNWYLADSVFENIKATDELGNLSANKLASTAETIIPARMEVIKIKDKTLIIDGSHNGPKMAALVEGVQKLYPNIKCAALVSFVDSKYERATPALGQLKLLDPALIVTSFSGEQDTPKHSVDVVEIDRSAGELKFREVVAETVPEKAFEKLLSRPEKLLIVTGSFYLLNHIRPLILKK